MILQNCKICFTVFTGKQLTSNKYTANAGNIKHSTHKEDKGFSRNSNKSAMYKNLLFFPHPDLHMMTLMYIY